MLIVAVGAGAAVGFIARPGPTPTPPPTPTPTPTPEPDTGPLVFQQPLSSGCATSDDVFVVSNGGGIGLFDGKRWSLIDNTLRSLVNAACTRDTVLAVGGAGRVLVIDDVQKTIRAEDVGIYDLNGISLLPDGALVVGEQGSVQRQSAQGWIPYAQGLDEDLFGVAGFSANSAWAVGAGGVSYRLEAQGWRPFDTGTTASLRTVAGSSASDAIAAGDDGVLLRFDGKWRELASGVKTTLRASVRAGGTTYVTGDGGVVLQVTGGDVTRVELGTSCAITGVFARANEIWFVGSEGLHAGVWRRIGDRIERWGTC